jgi:hypothetical protein
MLFRTVFVMVYSMCFRRGEQFWCEFLFVNRVALSTVICQIDTS